MRQFIFICFYLIGNLLSVYVIYQFFSVFFHNQIQNLKTDILIYGLYFISTSTVYLVFNIPILTMFTNIIFLSLITLLYYSTFLKRIFAIGIVYGVSLLIESCVVVTASYFHWKNMEISSVIISRIILLIVVQLLQTNSYVKRDIFIPKIQWLAIVVFPIGSIILFQILTYGLMKDGSLLLCLVILLIFDLLVFYIFNKLNSEYMRVLHEKLKLQEKEMETRMYLREKNIYKNQIKIMNDTHEKLNILQHDMKGHYFSLKSLIENNEIEEVKQYLERMFQTMNGDEMYVNTGNVTITSILNYYIKQVKKMNIKIEYDIKIPEELNIESYDLSTILINLLQNALEALEKNYDEKYMKLKLAYDKNIFYIMIENTYDGNVKVKHHQLQTIKEHQTTHGFGINSVMKSVERYHGEIEYDYTDTIFKVYIMLYTK